MTSKPTLEIHQIIPLRISTKRAFPSDGRRAPFPAGGVVAVCAKAIESPSSLKLNRQRPYLSEFGCAAKPASPGSPEPSAWSIAIEAIPSPKKTASKTVAFTETMANPSSAALMKG